MSKNNHSEQWISMSDMMTGLMLIFLLIAVSFMYQVQEKQKQKNQILFDYNNSRKKLYNKLEKSFSDKTKLWWMKIDKDLTIKFNVDFDPDSYQIKEKLKNILDKFIPEYIKIINNPNYKNRIKEVRIEWHTWECKDFEYEECLVLSQRRANSVLLYIQNSPAFKKLSQKDKDKLNFWFSSNWLWDWKLLDKNWNYIYKTKLKVDNQKSRRVEFKIITNSDSTIKNIINK